MIIALLKDERTRGESRSAKRGGRYQISSRRLEKETMMVTRGSYIVQVPILRAALYNFLLCENTSSFLSNNADVTKVIGGFLLVFPTPPQVADDYVPPTAEEVEERLQAQLALQRRLVQGSSSSSSSSAPILHHDAPDQDLPSSSRRRLDGGTSAS